MVGKNGRLNVYLKPKQREKINDYVVKTVNKQRKVPSRIEQKILRWAFDEWIEKHGEDYDIDWDSRE